VPQPTALSLAKAERQLIRVAFEGGGEIRGFLAFVTEYGRQRFPPSVAERIALASNELLENAARFGSLASEVAYALELHADYLEVVVTNTTVGPRVDMLSEHVRRLERDAEGVYSSELGRSLGNGGRRSMLGLARIRYEGGMTLALGVSGNQVTVRARCTR
jgi:hypothetical protein